MRPRSGFTLLELCLAVAIGLLIITMMIPSMSGMFNAQKLQRTFEEFDAFVRDAQKKSITERRDYVMVFEEGAISLEPAEPDENDEGVEMPHLPIAEGADIVIERPVALEKDPAMEWYFWKSGVCEPVIASYKGPLGTWTVQYDPLTARGSVLEQNSQ
jgi:type II secretory pathway pseudopilin PulG